MFHSTKSLLFVLFITLTQSLASSPSHEDVLQLDTKATEAFMAIANLINTTRSKVPKHLQYVFEALYENKRTLPKKIVTAAVDEATDIVCINSDNQAAQDILLGDLRFIVGGGDPATMPITKQFSALDLFYTYSAITAATNNNTANTLVQRDASGNFAATTISANLTGNVTGNLTGNVTGNLVGNSTGIHTGNVTGNVVGNITGTAGAATYFGGIHSSKILPTNTANSIALRDGSGNLTANTFTGNLVGNSTGIHTGNVTGNVVGNVTGNLTGNVAGNVVGNITGTAGAATYFGGIHSSKILSTNTANSIVLRDKNADIAAREINVTTALNMTSTGATIWVNSKPILQALGDTANSNIYVGVNAGNFTLTTSQNTVLGSSALQNNLRGSNNTVLGYTAGSNLLFGNNNIYCGNSGISKESSIIRLGTTTTHTACFIAGITTATVAKNSNAVFIDAAGRLGTITSSKRFKKDITDLADKDQQLNSLRPVAFRYNEQTDDKLQYGLIAEEVAEIMPELVIHNEQGDIQSVAYHMLPILLLQQHQKQQKLLADYAQQLDLLQQELVQIKSQLS